MKKTILFLTLFTISLSANYTYGGNNMGNIDMHGGKEQKLVPNQMKMDENKFNFNGFNDLSINKPKAPIKPEVKELIKEKKKEEKKDTNE